jgi:hypothetical protein
VHVGDKAPNAICTVIRLSVAGSPVVYKAPKISSPSEILVDSTRRGVPSVGLQHGFIYRHWLNYRHEPDEIEAVGADRGCPLPDKTLVFDRYAADYLTDQGHFPEARLAVTGNPRLDDLVTGVSSIGADERARLRTRLGARPEQRLAVLAAKFTEIRDELPALAAAMAGLPDVHLAIKPHPAETPDVYAPVVASRANMAVAPADAGLASLMACCDGLVTMNSTVAIDGLALGVPALVIGLPNNLSPFVTAGVMLGAGGPEAIGPGLRALLYDREVRDGLARAATAFVARYGMQPTGRAAERASGEILALADRDRPRRTTS